LPGAGVLFWASKKVQAQKRAVCFVKMHFRFCNNVKVLGINPRMLVIAYKNADFLSKNKGGVITAFIFQPYGSAMIPYSFSVAF
jgi:hypothetical protein